MIWIQERYKYKVIESSRAGALITQPMAIVLLTYQSDLIVEEAKDSFASIALTLELIKEAEVIEEKGILH